jgi:intracellular septation protein A
LATPQGSAAKPSPWLELLITIVVPALVLMQLSSASRLGPAGALLLALAFPLGWGARELIRQRKLNLMAAIGVVSTLLTGGIGLLALDPKWLAVKEAAVPGAIGLAVLISARTRYPLVRVLVFNRALFDVERVQQALRERGTETAFEAKLLNATVMLAGTFLFSAVMNYLLARWVVTSPAGSEAFNAELGRMTLLSYPVIAIPSMLMMAGVMFYLARGARRLSGLELEQMLRHAGEPG